MVLPMGPHRAHITRKAARTETGGHWAVGEAWQDPGFDNPPHTHDEAEAFYVLEGSYTFYTDADPVEDVGPGHVRPHSGPSRPRLSDWTARRQAHLLMGLYAANLGPRVLIRVGE